MALDFLGKTVTENSTSYYEKLEGNFADLNPVFEKSVGGADPADLDRYTIEFFAYNGICKCAFFAEFDTPGNLITGLMFDFPANFLSATAQHPLQPIAFVDGVPSVISSPSSMISQPHIAYFKDAGDNEFVGFSGLYVMNGSLKFVLRTGGTTTPNLISAKRFQSGFEWQKRIYLFTV